MVSTYLNRHCGPRFHLYKIYIEFRSFGGICCGGILTLQKTRFGGPGKSSLWSVLDYCFLRVFMGLDEFLQVCDVFFCGLWRSCFIKNLVLLTKTYFFSQKTTQNKVLIARPVFFRDLVDVGCMMMISSYGKYLSQPSLRTKISFIYLKSI